MNAPSALYIGVKVAAKASQKAPARNVSFGIVNKVSMMHTESREYDCRKGVADDPFHHRTQDLQKPTKEVCDSTAEESVRLSSPVTMFTYTRAAPFPAAPLHPIKVHETEVAVIKNPINALYACQRYTLQRSIPDFKHWTYIGVGFPKVFLNCPATGVLGERYKFSKVSLLIGGIMDDWFVSNRSRREAQSLASPFVSMSCW